MEELYLSRNLLTSLPETDSPGVLRTLLVDGQVDEAVNFTLTGTAYCRDMCLIKFTFNLHI